MTNQNAHRPVAETGSDFTIDEETMTSTEYGDGLRFLVIYNPIAGQRHKGFFARCMQALRDAGAMVRVQETRSAADAEHMARTADLAACDVIVAAGGDGTINDVVNGLSGRHVPLGIIPLGTANVLAAEIGVAVETKAVVAALTGQKYLTVSVADTIFPDEDSRNRFTMMAGVGFDAKVVAGVNARLKAAVGKGAYVWSAIRQFFRYQPDRYQVMVDGQTYAAASVIVANGHYYAGKYVCAPDAKLEDRTVEVCLFTRAGRLSVLRYGVALGMNRLSRRKDMTILRGTSVQVTGPASDPVQVDGDIAGQLPVTIRANASQLLLLSPLGRVDLGRPDLARAGIEG